MTRTVTGTLVAIIAGIVAGALAGSTTRVGIIMSAIGKTAGTAVFGTYFLRYLTASTSVAVGLLIGTLPGYNAVAHRRWGM